MWDSKLATRRREVARACASRREARAVGASSFWARRATRALERSERHAHRRFLSAALRDQRVLAVVYGEKEEEEDPLPIWKDPFTGAWWRSVDSVDRFEDLDDLVDLYLP